MYRRSTLIRCLAVLLVPAVLSGSPCAAQDFGVVFGKVTDSEAQGPLAGASILVKGTHVGTVADDAGTYHLVGVPVGRQVVVCSFIGFESKEVAVDVAHGREVRVDFVLESRALESGEVLVTGFRSGQ